MIPSSSLVVFVGMPLSRQLAKRFFFTDFARTTSWRLQSEYEPLDHEIETRLHHFFAPYNDLLFRLIDRNLTKEW